MLCGHNPTGQPSRFANSESEIKLWQLGGLAKSGSDSEEFFAGPISDQRMTEVREAISYIRLNWHHYPQFMKELGEFVEGAPDPEPVRGRRAEWKQGPSLIETLLANRKEWPELRDGPDDNDYSAVKLYTSEYGYRKIFSHMNIAFRDRLLTKDHPERLRAITFLVELLNIDLYRYIGRRRAADNFVGRVYRGMRVSSEGLYKFARTASAENLATRYVSIPLYMMSASDTRRKALPFARRTAESSKDSHALLWDISVYSLDPALLVKYKQSYPNSIVTSLCAVPIKKLSPYSSREREVLLRGPFFQVVRMYTDRDSLKGEPLHVVRAVMLNSNRDHVTAVATNTGEDKRMREIFRDMAIASRSVKCAEYAEFHGQLADAEYYRSAARQASAGFSHLWD
jgi:hypothetical protein